mmetsp:Transcript_38993/g.63473  ORF Transcript_38993/g.63473 Transcript_38993/m.63473 type:complete len:238 (-) Transcript_38993:8-721(-)
MLDRTYEKSLCRTHFDDFKEKQQHVVVGIDEAGRGPLAGPVVAAACHIPFDVQIDGINDSKKVQEADREALFKILTEHPRVKYAVSIIDARGIEKLNILHAAMAAMDGAFQKLNASILELPSSSPSKTLVLIDGPRVPPKLKDQNESSFDDNVPFAVLPVVKGDSKCFSIAAASIIAKVSRDRIMYSMHKKWPKYQFARHKGYPTALHVQAIRQHGPCEIHRMTFAPLKHWYPTSSG